MIERHQIDKGKFIIPSGSQMPDWVIDRINGFKETLYKIAKSSREPNKENHDQIVRALYTFIIPHGIKLTKRLSKPEVAKLTQEYAKVLDDLDFTYYIWLLMNAGFFLSTVLPISIDEDSLTIPDEFKQKRIQINKEFKISNDKQKYLKDIAGLSAEILDYMINIDNAFGNFLESKANGSLDHIQELLVGVGLAFNAKGEIIDTVTSCLVEGVEQTEYFSKGSTGIAALFAKSSETSKPGYLGKKLSNICEKVKLASEKDCQTKKLLKIQSQNPNFLKAFIGRWYSIEQSGKNLKIFNEQDAKNFINKPIYFRSALYCRSKNHYICSTCYSPSFIKNHSIKPGDNIGLYASTGITGFLVSLTLKKSHIGINTKNENIDLRKDLGIL
jgi:hypothetical protein